MTESIKAPASQVRPHALEPLSSNEISTAASIVRHSVAVEEDAQFAFITLNEPPKEAVLTGATVHREALAVVLDRGRRATIEAVVSLDTGQIRSWREIRTGQPNLLNSELVWAMNIVRADEGWRAAMRSRGIEDFESIQLDPWPVGSYRSSSGAETRAVRVLSYLRRKPSDNPYARPIEGLIVDVDLLAERVLEIQDFGQVPIPPEDGNYDAESAGPPRSDLRPLDIVQAEGPSFHVSGNEVRWQKWRLRVSMHPLDGLVLHSVGYEDGGRVRPILYRAGLAEMVVPYGEVSPMHSWKSVFDSGEYGLGRFPFLNSLELGCDCLGAIHYFDVVVADDRGEPKTLPNAICMHEEDYGILWKHRDLNTSQGEVRRSRRLVVSSIHTVGNYDYGFYWYFYQDGSLELQVKLTGILQTMALLPGEQPRHGEVVAPQLAGPHHQHLFCFRLDLDIDGVDNAVLEGESELLPDQPENPYGSSFVVRETVLERESAAKRVVDPRRGRYWKVINPNVRNRLGQHPGYRLAPGPDPTLLALPNSDLARRAAFATNNLWVTPFRHEERRAAGDYPFQHRGDAGLPAWTTADRPLANTDVVLWHTFGITHVVRPEDWPVMPVEYTGFTLKPAGFFERNPALDVPFPSNDHCLD